MSRKACQHTHIWITKAKKNMLGSTPVSSEQKYDASMGTGYIKLDTWKTEGKKTPLAFFKVLFTYVGLIKQQFANNNNLYHTINRFIVTFNVLDKLHKKFWFLHIFKHLWPDSFTSFSLFFSFLKVIRQKKMPLSYVREGTKNFKYQMFQISMFAHIF